MCRLALAAPMCLLLYCLVALSGVCAAAAFFLPPDYAGPAPGVPLSLQQHVRICYLNFGGLSDLGWSFNFNVGRLKVHHALVAEYPNRTFESHTVLNVASKDAIGVHRVVLELIASGCSVLVDNNPYLFNLNEHLYADAFPNVTFVSLSEPRLLDRNRSNLVFFANDYTEGYFIAGAAAAAQSRTCIAFFSAWDDESDTTNAFAGFLAGVRRVKTTVPVHVVTSSSWYDPSGDALLARLFTDVAGCDVVARFSDPFAVDQFVAAHRSDVFSVGCHSNLQQYVGDTVLTSVYLDWSVSLLDVLRSLLEYGVYNKTRVPYYYLHEDAVAVAPASPRARAGVAAEMASAAAYIQNMTSSREDAGIICGDLRLRFNHTSDQLRLSEQRVDGCKRPWVNIGDYVVDDHVVDHGTWRRPESCPPGSRVEYAFTPALTLVCTPCPPGTYTLSPGSLHCSLCSEGSTSTVGSTSCVTGPVVAVGVVIAVCISGFVAATLIGGVYFAVVTARRMHANAPTSAPMTLVVIDIEAYQALLRADPDATKAALHQFVLLVRSLTQRCGGYEVRQVEDRVVVAFRSVLDGLTLAVELLEKLHSAQELPSVIRDIGGLKPRITLHHCERKEDVQVFFSFHEGRYDYRGPAVTAAYAVAAVAVGGAIACSEATLAALQADEAFTLVMAFEVTVKAWRGLKANVLDRTSAMQLFTISSRHLDAVARAEVTCGDGGVTEGQASLPLLPGMDPELAASIHSSRISNVSSATINQRTCQLGRSQVAIALFTTLCTVEEIATDSQRIALAHALSGIFGVDATVWSARRFAATIATKVFDAVDGAAQSKAAAAANPLAVLCESPLAAAAPPEGSHSRLGASSEALAHTVQMIPWV